MISYNFNCWLLLSSDDPGIFNDSNAENFVARINCWVIVVVRPQDPITSAKCWNVNNHFLLTFISNVDNFTIWKVWKLHNQVSRMKYWLWLVSKATDLAVFPLWGNWGVPHGHVGAADFRIIDRNAGGATWSPVNRKSLSLVPSSNVLESRWKQIWL